MAIDEKYIELINAGIDGEISTEERAELDRFLRDSAEGRQLQADLEKLCGTLDAVEELSPPPHLKHVILDAVRPRERAMESTSIWQTLFAAPAVRYAGAFALGIILAVTIISSDQISRNAFDDITGLVGTISSTTAGDTVPAGSRISVSNSEVAGTVKLQRTGQIMVIDFDLYSSEPIEIVADFADPDVWFNGFAQLESTGTSVSAESGRVTLMMDGKRRCALYLHNASGAEATVNLRFFAAGTLIQEEVLQFSKVD